MSKITVITSCCDVCGKTIDETVKLCSHQQGIMQALACQSLNGEVSVIANLPDGVFMAAVSLLKRAGINTAYLNASTKVLSVNDIRNAKACIEESRALILTCDISPDVIKASFKTAMVRNVPTLLSCRAKADIPQDILTIADVAVLDDGNENTARSLVCSGCKNVIVKANQSVIYLGVKGRNTLQIKNGEKSGIYSSVFDGALAVAVAEGVHITEAVEFANAAALISVNGIPNRMDADDEYIRLYGE